MNTACLYLSEARSMVSPSTYPRLHSLRSFSLGLLRVSLYEAVSYCCAWRMGINPTPTFGDRGFRGASAARYADVGLHPVPRRHTLSNPRLSERSECSLGDR